MTRVQANLLLLVAAGLWGFGNVAQKTVLEHLDPLSAVGLRCLIAAALVGPLVLVERGTSRRGFAASTLRVSGLLAAALAVQQTAFLGTSVTNASFLVNTATVMTPLAAWIRLGDLPGPRVAASATLTLFGALLLCGGIRGGIGPGDAAAMLSAAFYALWIVELARHAQEHGRPAATAAIQFAATGLLLVPAGVLTGGLSAEAAWQAGPELVILGVFSTAIAFGLQSLAQRYTSASTAAIIVSAESVFGGVAGAVALGERVSPAGLAGCMLVLAAIVLVAVPARAFRIVETAGPPEAMPR